MVLLPFPQHTRKTPTYGGLGTLLLPHWIRPRGESVPSLPSPSRNDGLNTTESPYLPRCVNATSSTESYRSNNRKYHSEEPNYCLPCPKQRDQRTCQRKIDLFRFLPSLFSCMTADGAAEVTAVEKRRTYYR
jgi:hypothetical protein